MLVKLSSYYYFAGDRKAATPIREAPPPPSKSEDPYATDKSNSNKKVGPFKKSKEKSKNSQAPAEAPTAPSQAKPASRDTPPTKEKDLVTMRAAEPVRASGQTSKPRSGFKGEEDEGDWEAREVQNDQLYMFDTESEEEEEEGEEEVDTEKLITHETSLSSHRQK